MNSSATIHPHTGTDYRTPIYVSPSGRKFFPIGGAAEPTEAEAAAAATAATEKAAAEKAAADAAAKKAADDAAAAAYTAPKTQAELDAIITRRLDRERASKSDYDDLKAKAAELDTLKAASATEQEKAIKAAQDAVTAKERETFVPQLVKAEFKAAAKGVLTDEQLSSLLEDLDLSKYVDDKGVIDEEKVAKKVTALAPANGGNGQNGGQRHVLLGQGQRPGVPTTPGANGLAQAQKRFPKKYENTKS